MSGKARKRTTGAQGVLERQRGLLFRWGARRCEARLLSGRTLVTVISCGDWDGLTAAVRRAKLNVGLVGYVLRWELRTSCNGISTRQEHR